MTIEGASANGLEAPRPWKEVTRKDEEERTIALVLEALCDGGDGLSFWGN